MSKRSLMLLGPHSTGKTDVAVELAKHWKGEIIPADKFYLFSGFEALVGLAPGWKDCGVKLHLYGSLAPQWECLPAVEYAMMAATAAEEIWSREGLPIVEGCSFGYCSYLMDWGGN